jgi:hypothetical protein
LVFYHFHRSTEPENRETYEELLSNTFPAFCCALPGFREQQSRARQRYFSSQGLETGSSDCHIGMPAMIKIPKNRAHTKFKGHIARCQILEV